MSFRKTVGTFMSSDGVSQIRYYVYTPDSNPRAVLQISHGMCEYIERYENGGFVEAMCEQGFVVCGNDHIGHGNSASSPKELGYITDYNCLVEDLNILNGIMKKTYRSLPYILLGHSMGSFVARKYITQYQNIDGVILSGSSGGGQPLAIAKALASLIGRIKGDHYRAKMLYNLSFSGYNKNFSEEKDKNSWLSSDKTVRQKYASDPFCNYVFTVTGYRELFSLLLDISSDEWYSSVPQSLPMLIVSGELDPVGANGEGIKELYALLEEKELSDLSIKLYDGGRHELHNDVTAPRFFNDLSEWIGTVCDGVIECRSYNLLPFGQIKDDN